MSTSPTINPLEIYGATLALSEIPYKLGTVGYDDDGNKYIFVRANGNIVDKANLLLKPGFDVSTSGAGGLVCGINSTGQAIVDNEYFWMQIGG